MSRIPIEQHKPWPKKVYKYHVVNSKGQDVETDLPSEDHARVVIDYWHDQDVHDLHIEVEHKPQVKKGFGRDPDLH